MAARPPVSRKSTKQSAPIMGHQGSMGSRPSASAIRRQTMSKGHELRKSTFLQNQGMPAEQIETMRKVEAARNDKRLSAFLFAAAPNYEMGTTGGLNLIAMTSNAMALIAPGAFLWITFQVQAAVQDTSGNSYAKDMWFGMALAVFVCLFTAAKYAELARKYPDAGDGGAYSFAIRIMEQTTVQRLKPWSWSIKMFIGWAAHLYYWVYPGVMIACMANLVEYICMQMMTPGKTMKYSPAAWNTTGLVYMPDDNLVTLSPNFKILYVFLATSGVGGVCSRGISGSTGAAAFINIVQLSMLIFTSVLFYVFRTTDPLGVMKHGSKMEWDYKGLADVTMPHSGIGVLYQASVAILILVGFDSATSQAGSAEQPSRDVPRAVMLSLTVQGFFAYFLEYSAADMAMGTFYGKSEDARGLGAAALSGAPIGDLVQIVGDQLLFLGAGKLLMLALAASVTMAVFGSSLAAMGTAVRFTEAMAEDGEIPRCFATPNAQGMPKYSVMVLSVVTFLLGCLGSVGGATTLLAVGTASNIGTFLLYAAVCALCYASYKGTREFNYSKHVVIPVIGFLLNVLMLTSILGIGYMAGGASRTATFIALYIAGVFTVIAFLIVTNMWPIKQIRGSCVKDESDEELDESDASSGSEEEDSEKPIVAKGKANVSKKEPEVLEIDNDSARECHLVCQYDDDLLFEAILDFS